MHSLTQTRCVMFDLDGTLVDSAPDITTSLNLMLEELKYPRCNLQQVRKWMGNGADSLVKRALTRQFDGNPNQKVFLHARELFREFYARHLCEDSFIYPGVIDGLNALSNHSCVLACITNKPRRFTPGLLQALMLDHYFEYLICGDDLPQKKPHPLPLQKVLKDTGLLASQALMVGDSASDIQAAKAAHIKSFCLRYGYDQGKGVDALGADYIIGSIAEIPHYIRRAA